MRLNVIDSLWHRKDDMQRRGQSVTMKTVGTTGLDVKRLRAKFAFAAAAEEFGGRYFGWREWAEFEDQDVDQIEARRYEALWSR